MPLHRDHLVLLLAGGLVGAGLASVLPVFDAPEPRETRPEAPTEEFLRVQGIAHVAGGEAEAALPLLPLEAGGNGTLLGRTTAPDLPGGTHPIVDWHRACLPKGETGLPDADDGSAPLRYLEPGEADVGDPYGGHAPWYEGRHGDPVHADDLPPGRPAYATWGGGGDGPADRPVVVLLKMNASHRSGDHDPFTEEGVLAFGARAPTACRVVAVAPDVPPSDRAGVRQVVEDHPRISWPPEPEVAVDPAGGDAWDPAVVVGDAAVLPPRPPAPGP